MKKVLVCLLAVGSLGMFVSGCKCAEKSSTSKDECEVAVPKDTPAAAVPMDHPSH